MIFKSSITKFATTVLFMISVISHPSSAQKLYSSDLLVQMVESMQLSAAIDTMHDGIFPSSLSYKGYPLTVIVEHGEVHHIGYTLFATHFHTLDITPACRFIERYLLWSDLPLMRQHPIALDMELNDIIFKKGDLHSVKKLMGDTNSEVSVSFIGGKKYRIVWQRLGNTVCEVEFPVDYCLLKGTTLQENEQRLQSDLEKMYMLRNDTMISEPINPLELRNDGDTNIFILGGDSIYVASLNSNQFFVFEDSVFSPLFSPDHINESFANLFVSHRVVNNYSIKIRLIQYGHKTSECTVPLQNLNSYFARKKCTPYFGVMSEDEANVTGLLLLVNTHEGYCHLLRLKLPKLTFASTEGEIQGRMSAFIPISRIKSLY